MTGKKSKDFAELPHFEQSAQAKKELLEAVKVLGEYNLIFRL